MNPNSSRKVSPTNQGFIQDLLLRAKLIYRLMGDKRVNGWLKLLPVATMVYLVSPIDLVPLGLDDALVVWGGMTLFVELCPQAVVEEQLTNLRLNIPGVFHKPADDEVVVDAEYREVDN